MGKYTNNINNNSNKFATEKVKEEITTENIVNTEEVVVSKTAANDNIVKEDKVEVAAPKVVKSNKPSKFKSLHLLRRAR